MVKGVTLSLIIIITAVVDCGPLGDPENGMVSASITTYNSMATYSCNTGYTLTGNVSRTCLANGLWSGSEPNCTSKPKIIKFQSVIVSPMWMPVTLPPCMVSYNLCKHDIYVIMRIKLKSHK